ncbi:MAG: hypothetical protein FJ077_07020 [Cyanobacteria bacterium K_DeepCast_35m_m2_023]|nr:hypothetical protein [Cyanobacteria bacterium K_DeepCast_35m_m2_023]
MSLRVLLASLPCLAFGLPAVAAPAMVPFNPKSPTVRAELQAVQSDTVEQFDPVARAKVLVAELPRRWSGTFVPSASGGSQTVQLELANVTSVGQMVVLTGTMTVGSVTTSVQGNLNAKSDQLDLLLLGDTTAAGIEPGGLFQGLQSFQLSNWEAPRLTNPGGKLMLNPAG